MNVKKIILLLAGIGIFAGLIYVLNNGMGTKSGDTQVNNDHNETYKDLQSKIKKLETKAWNAGDYMAIKMSIQQAENATPKPLIKAKDVAELRELLNSTYLNVLFKEVKRFCETEPLSNQGYLAIKDEIIKEIPENSKTASIRSSIIRSLDLFQSATNLPTAIEDYTKNYLYNSSRTQGYSKKIDDIKADRFISINTSVTSVLNPQKIIINTHKELHEQIDRILATFSSDPLKAKNYACRLASQNNYKRYTAYSRKYC